MIQIVKVLVFALWLLPFRIQAEEGCGPVEEFHRGLENEWAVDDYWTVDQLQRFWEIHQRFGFVRYHDRRIYLVTKSERLSEQIIQDLLKYSGKKDSVTEGRIPELSKEIVLDVTDILTDVMKRLHNNPLYESGPNCWNLCMFGKSSNGSLYMDGPEFSNWIDSPFAREITDRKMLRPGDLMVFRKNEAFEDITPYTEVHGAIYISERLAAAKTGLGDEYMHRLLDINESLSYLYPKRADYVRVYRVEPVRVVLDRFGAQMPGKIRELYEKTWTAERKLEEYYVDLYGVEVRDNNIFRPLLREIRQLGVEMERAAVPQIERLEGLSQRTEAQEFELTMWKGLKFKSITFAKPGLH